MNRFHSPRLRRDARNRLEPANCFRCARRSLATLWSAGSTAGTDPFVIRPFDRRTPMLCSRAERTLRCAST